MKPVAHGGQPLEELDNPLFAALRVGVRDGHGVLGGIPVAQPGAPPHLDEGGEPGEHHIDLALVQVPGVQHHVQVRVGGGRLELGQLSVPVPGQIRQGPVHGGGVPEAVEAVRLKGGGHELAGVLIEQLVVDDAVGAAAPGAVEGHLEVLVVDGDLVVGELGVGVHAQRAGAARGVFQGQVPQLHVLPPGDSPRRCG